MAYNLESLIQILEQILHPQDHCRPAWILDPRKKPIIESLLTKSRFLKEFFENPSSVTDHGVLTLESEIRGSACHGQNMIIESILQNVWSLKQLKIIRRLFPKGNQCDFPKGNLESRIRDAAYHAQNIIESHLASQLLSIPKGGKIMISPPYNSLQKIEGYEFKLIMGEIRKIIDGSGASPSNIVSSSNVVTSMQDLNPKSIVVGIHEDLIQLKEQLMMEPQSKLEIIPIVGMGGIGKTTFARTLYNDQSIVFHFDTRAWIPISQNYNEREMLLGLLKCITGKLSDKMFRDENDKLALYLHKNLWGRRYLIVLDDMWSSEAWDCVRMFFPDEHNGSRILVTTREQSVANCVAGIGKSHHQMKFLNENESWSLLCSEVFGEESCPHELERIGKNIAKACRGLPLAIHVVGGVLSRLDKTQVRWMQVAKDNSFSLADSDEQLSNILSLSYNHLPNYLKPCFLFMGAFPEDCEIRASQVINLWVAEGFLKPISGMSFEEAAQVYLNELVGRNLLLVAQKETKRNVKSYIMHDILRDLCIRKAREEKFLYVGMDDVKELDPKEMLRLRLSVHSSHDQVASIINSPGTAAITHSVLIFDKGPRCYKHIVPNLPWHDNIFRLRLLRVLHITAAKFGKFPKEIERLVNLRYLAMYISTFSNIHPTISNLWSLQTLIFYLDRRVWFVELLGLFDLPQLRHIKFKGIYPLFALKDGENVARRQELQTLSTVAIDESFPRILEAVPNLKKLGIHERADIRVHSMVDLSCLNELEILKCSSEDLAGGLLKFIILPPSLKKLTLFSCAIPWWFRYEIGKLPSLEVLKMKDSFFVGAHEELEVTVGKLSRLWKPAEGEFQQLRLLQLERFCVEKWIADETHYPRLERLVIRDCIYLEEIPSGIGDIPTLERIEVHGRSRASALESARKIQQEQIEFGNDALQVCINAGVDRSWQGILEF